MTTGVAIIGCGGVGRKRRDALPEGCRLVACADIDEQTALRFAPYDRVHLSWENAISRNDVDLVIVSTTHDALAEIACAALEAGKHVLVEKPAAISVTEVAQIVLAQKNSGKHVRVGFNHRFHPALQVACWICDHGEIGLTMMVRGRYGHGGRVGYEKEWRAMPIRGGGELLDQGVHMIDLASMFLGSFTRVTGFARTLYWPMACDDNAFMLLETEDAKVAQLHVSCTEWKNTFSLEIYGTRGKIHIEGLGGSYGVERCTHYLMGPEMGPPQTTILEFPGPDTSWGDEMQAFLKDIELDRSPSVGLAQARAALEVVERIREQSGER